MARKHRESVILLIASSLIGSSLCLTAQSSSIKFPNTYQGEWVSKPVYSYQTKHIKKNMAIPAMKIIIHGTNVKWHFKGYLPKAPGIHYDHSVHTLKASKMKNNIYSLKGNGPFGKTNLFSKTGKHLHYFYQNGGDITLTRK